MLTDDEIVAVDNCTPGGRTNFARAVEAAVLSKLAAGVTIQRQDDGFYEYTADQLTAAIAAARVQENERLACEFDKLYTYGGDEIGPAIRSLIGAKT